MPIYEYRRPDGTTFEVLQSMSEDALTEDPETGVPVTKVMHAPSIHFKGSGFYNTDYGKKTKGATKPDSGSSSDTSGDSSSSSDSSDSKSESKSETKPDSKTKSKSSDNGSSSSTKPKSD